MLALEMEEGGPCGKECERPLGAGKDKEIDSPTRSPELLGTNFVLFENTKFVSICCTINRKHIYLETC